MSTKHLLDPEIAPIIEALPSMEMTYETLPAIREMMAQMALADQGDAEAANVTRDEVYVPGYNGGPEVRCLRYSSNARRTPSPVFIHIHGGGYLMGSPEMMDTWNVKAAGEQNILVLSVDYRHAPENPIPAPLDDCYAVLAWVHENAAELGVDPTRVGIGGESCGGGLAAALALMARDIGDYPVHFQLLVVPMIDDKTGTDERPADPTTGEFVWTRDNNKLGWNAYLGDAPRIAPQVPSRAETLRDLPNTWLATAQLDLFREENVEYAERLMADGVATELVIYPSVCHGWQLAKDAAVSKRYEVDYFNALKRGLHAEDI